MKDDIVSSIASEMADARVEVALDGNRALITVISAEFENMNRVQKQQKVYGCIDGYLADGRLHAVTIKALTPAEVE